MLSRFVMGKFVMYGIRYVEVRFVDIRYKGVFMYIIRYVEDLLYRGSLFGGYLEICYISKVLVI